MSLTPPSDRPEFDGFAAYFETDIAPYLRARETKRREAVNNFLILAGAVGVLGLSIILFGPFPSGDNLQMGLLVAALGAGGGMWFVNRARDDIAAGLLERICGRLGFSYRLKIDRPAFYERFRTLGLLPRHNREEWEDGVRGAHAGAGFEMCEAHLKIKTSGKNNSTRTVFHGQILVIDYPKRFLGTTVVKRDAGPLNRFHKPGKDFSQVGLASAEFERAFEAWSTDQVEARDLLDPVVLERFQELERLFGGKKLRAAFDGGKLMIAIETGDRLNMGSMFKPLESRERIETILREFDVIFDLIDVLVRRVDAPMTGAFSVDRLRSAQ